jgi:hypothetical protein
MFDNQDVRRANLKRVAEQFSLEPGPDYDYQEVADRLEGREPILKYVALRHDETYNFADFVESLSDGANALEENILEETGNTPHGVLDLDTLVWFDVDVSVTVNGKTRPWQGV